MQLQALFTSGHNDAVACDVQRFRKSLFVDKLGWSLNVIDGREVDQFDTAEAVYLSLFGGSMLLATFRACRTDRAYLADSVFPQLAVVSAYPHRADVWEISRLGVDCDGDARQIARINYALMFYFARRVGAASLVAIADLTYERFLRTLGIRTRRYGPPQVIGADRYGRGLQAVAGEIPIADQDPRRLANLLTLLSNVEIIDAAEIFGRSRISA